MAQPRRTSKQSKQAGGTFLGIVLGLIVGLAIAVVVALYITRSPSPFVSKVAPPPTDTGASQPQQFDPNRALQGKTPGQPVPQAAQPAPPNTAPGQAANQTQGGLLPEPQIVEVPPSGNANGSNTTASNNATSGNGVAVAPKPADNTPPPKKTQQAQQQQQGGEDDLARFAAQKQAQQAAAQKQQQQQLAANTPKPAPSATSATSAAAAKPPTANDANTGYFLQVGAYKTEGDAEQQRARLGFQGFESKVSKRDVSGVTYFRVRVGPFSKFEDMNSARQRLSDAGVDTAVIRFTKQ
ncbi:SPOR domain-containing protein [Burkholderia ambifaria]|uniref:Sporulation domain protein n=1 Tax=Burkholderia ambifaria (strain ATCC BAA-244 / DSM 16087 / CCUG 44356 / LMG 19182 / AMMD) TaxID=339670 RepID=Q0BBE8_BURCM|nr:SPOR domain-containing protein [Burkholderia ambifaria]ABI88525.1 Sporulation domain protein [Burkholderia ambifaria AMMD]AJY21719.1 sporulation related domain protein [Burkholderia ambifaria AMMD]ELK6210661.1 SPOR domain-containing protein [Burkholderia ambifaria]MBR7931358.1 SPOR domain-containing protein [Burkholderia ambifaria]MBR8225165.1 SPOR domain-containing protein [Burkholderia ambifaria]